MIFIMAFILWGKEWKYHHEFTAKDGRRVHIDYNPPENFDSPVIYLVRIDGKPVQSGEFYSIWNDNRLEIHVREKLGL